MGPFSGAIFGYSQIVKESKDGITLMPTKPWDRGDMHGLPSSTVILNTVYIIKESPFQCYMLYFLPSFYPSS